MFRGIIVQHGHRIPRNRDLVRCDITGLIGFILTEDWPEGFQEGDFLEVILRGEPEFRSYHQNRVFDPCTRRAVRNYFMNGGDLLHVFGVCISSFDQLASLMLTSELFVSLIDRLRSEEDIALLAAPAAAYLPCEVYSNGDIFAGCEAVYTLLLQHCVEMNNRFLIMDVPQNLHEELLVRWVDQVRQRTQGSNHFGALYYPWLCEGEVEFPASSCVAGLFVEVEKQHPPIGIQWPPANIPLRGVSHASLSLDLAEVSDLAQAHINPIVTQPNRGLVPMGARTLSSDPIFKQVNSRRIMNLVLEQVRRDTEWAIFETHNPHLWAVLKRDVDERLEEFWAAGLLTRSSDGKRFEVKCDLTNNPPELRDAGQVNIEIRLQPVGTTEQILVDLSIGNS